MANPPPDRTGPRVRMSGPDRYDQLVRAGVSAFAARGYAGATTEDVARIAGVSQPYVIRVFGSKQALFLAAVHHACDEIETAFRTAAEEDPRLERLGSSFRDLLVRRELLLMLLHAFAASDDPAIGPVVRERFGAVYDLVRSLSGADTHAATNFLAIGMLLTVCSAMEAIGPDGVGTEPWATQMLDTLTPPDA